jgi:hypothetical protein
MNGMKTPESFCATRAIIRLRTSIVVFQCQSAGFDARLLDLTLLALGAFLAEPDGEPIKAEEVLVAPSQASDNPTSVYRRFFHGFPMFSPFLGS